MKDATIADLEELIDQIQDIGFQVTSVDLNQYGPPMSDDDEEVEGVEIDLTVFISYQDNEDDDNPFRFK